MSKTCLLPSGLVRLWVLRRAYTISALVCLFAASPLLGAEVELRALVDGRAPDEPPAVLLRVEPVGGTGPIPEGARASEVRLRAGEARAVRLRDGLLWAVRASAEGYWSPEVLVTPGDVDGAITIRLHPTGRLEIPVGRGRFGEVPERLEVRFEPAPGPGAARSELRSTVDCPVEEAVARCAVPAGRLDLRLSAAPWAPAYRLGVHVQPSLTVRLDPMELVRGASVSGRVERDGGEPPPEGTTVELTVASAGLPAAAPRLDLARQVVEVDERGFFQFLGVRPGVYGLVARTEGFAPARMAPVEVRPELESSLYEPLVLARPVALSLELDPPTDPWGEPWTVVLSHLSPDSPRPLSTTTMTAGEDGTLVERDMEPGTYSVTLQGANGTRWLREEVEVDRTSTFHPLTIPLVEVVGVVTRGGEAAAGTLWFGTRSGARRIFFDVDSEGEFEGLLPSPGEWPVEWLPSDGGEEGVRLRPVEVADDRRVELRIEIPDTEVMGEVVDPRGNAVEGATVRMIGERTAEATELSGATTTDADGRFRLSGLEPGLYAVQAVRDSARSGMTSLTLAEDLAGPDLRLVLQEELRISGRVTSGGDGVAGATVIGWPSFVGGSGASIRRTVTGPTGEFDLLTSGAPGPWNFLVTAPSLAVHMGVTQVAERGLVELAVDRYPGTLILDGLGALGGRALLVHNGTFLPVPGFLRMAFQHRAPRPAGDPLVIQGVEPGEYSLCDAGAILSGDADRQERCQTGVLAPYGELRLGPPGSSDSRTR